MSLSAIRSRMKTVLLDVTDVGTKVYEYERFAKDWNTYLSLFKANGLIKGWTISRTATPETTKTPTTNMRTHNMMIRGYYSLDDSAATEKTFQDLIEVIATAFRTDPTLNGTAFDTEPLQVSIVGTVMFGSVLCHFCELTLAVQEQEQWR